jgi:hypothetical protein
MKTILHAAILTAFLFSVQFVSGQKADTSACCPARGVDDAFTQKYKTGKTAAWLLLAPGATMAASRGVINVNNRNSFFKYGFNPRKAPAFGFLGSVMALSSIPFFIQAGNSRKKASLSLKREKIMISEKGPGNFRYLAVDLKIKL